MEAKKYIRETHNNRCGRLPCDTFFSLFYVNDTDFRWISNLHIYIFSNCVVQCYCMSMNLYC